MTWIKKSNKVKRKRRYSVIGKLEREGKINDAFLISLGRITLEELVAIKLELTSKSCGGSIYGLPIWYAIKDIIRDACLKFALSATNSQAEAASFLGITTHDMLLYIKWFNVKSYFDEEIEKPEEELRRY